MTAVEYITAMHDYKMWLQQYTEMVYGGARSNVFHFRIFQDEKDKTHAPCKYLQYSYHERYDNAKYMPYIGDPPSFCKELVEGNPPMDLTAGDWTENVADREDEDNTGKAKKTHRVQVNHENIHAKLSALLALQSNAATDEDIRWWDGVFESIQKGPDIAANIGTPWEYREPDCDKVNENSGYEAYDPRDLRGVEPPPPPLTDLLLFANMTKTQRDECFALANEVKRYQDNLKIHFNEFIVFMLEDEWKTLAAEIEGLSIEASSLNFGLGKVIRAPKQRKGQDDRASIDEATTSKGREEVQGDPWVNVWVQMEGNPNGVWKQWTHVGTKASPWRLQIPRDSIVQAGFEFRSSSTFGARQFTSKDKKSLGAVAKFPWSFVPGSEHGLVSTEEAGRILKKRMDDCVNRTSKEGQAAYRKACSAYAQHMRKINILRAVKQIEGSVETTKTTSQPSKRPAATTQTSQQAAKRSKK